MRRRKWILDHELAADVKGQPYHFGLLTLTESLTKSLAGLSDLARAYATDLTVQAVIKVQRRRCVSLQETHKERSLSRIAVPDEMHQFMGASRYRFKVSLRYNERVAARIIIWFQLRV